MHCTDITEFHKRVLKSNQVTIRVNHKTKCKEFWDEVLECGNLCENYFHATWPRKHAQCLGVGIVEQLEVDEEEALAILSFCELREHWDYDNPPLIFDGLNMNTSNRDSVKIEPKGQLELF